MSYLHNPMEAGDRDAYLRSVDSGWLDSAEYMALDEFTLEPLSIFDRVCKLKPVVKPIMENGIPVDYVNVPEEVVTKDHDKLRQSVSTLERNKLIEMICSGNEAATAEHVQIIVFAKSEIANFVERFGLGSLSVLEQIEAIEKRRADYVEALSRWCPPGEEVRLRKFVKGYIFGSREEQAEQAQNQYYKRAKKTRKCLELVEKMLIEVRGDNHFNTLRTHIMQAKTILKSDEASHRSIGFAYENNLILWLAGLYDKQQSENWKVSGSANSRFVQLCRAIFATLGPADNINTVRSRVKKALKLRSTEPVPPEFAHLVERSRASLFD